MTLDRRGLVIGGLAAGLSGCSGESGGEWLLRYALTVQISTAARSYNLSGVMESEYRRVRENAFPQTQMFHVRGRAQALTMLAPPGGVFCAVLAQVYGAHTSSFNPVAETTLIAEFDYDIEQLRSGEIFERIGKMEAPWNVRRDRWPTCLYFSNPADITSVALVALDEQPFEPSPGIPATTLRSVFGEDARISDVTLEISDNGISRGIERTFPWVDTMNGAGDRPTRQSRNWPLHENLAYRNFVTEE